MRWRQLESCGLKGRGVGVAEHSIHRGIEHKGSMSVVAFTPARETCVALYRQSFCIAHATTFSGERIASFLQKCITTKKNSSTHVSRTHTDTNCDTHDII